MGGRTVERLPRGQSAAPLLRFGLPQFATVRPELPDEPVVTVGGRVRTPVQIELGELLARPQWREQRSDLHCVTTWSALGLRWGGVPFRVVEDVLAARVHPRSDCFWVTFVGLDGYRSCLSLADARADDVLLADSLDGERLTVEQGAPARLVAPAHYGFKSVRSICAIEYRSRYDAGSAGWLAHRRGRVAHEERSPVLPGWVWRRVWRSSAEKIRQLY
jgi:DMSO/TMAO reductase YedYZ molybdopterin-dependent catalytic subunit